MSIIKILNKFIEYSFYSLFLLVPWAFTSDTFELFEFNKMWLTFGITIIIATSWFIKMILQKKIFIQRTPLDIPILFFLLALLISTIFSLDTHVSIWGYYSRFNGGFLSYLTYIFLYYAFVSNFQVKGVAANGAVSRQDPDELNGSSLISMTKRLLKVSLASGLIVALWGLPSHFGYDPTCLMFRGTFDVSCWTDQFKPMVRIFSTLGQPDWLAAYLAILIPIGTAFGILHAKSQNSFKEALANFKNWKFAALFFLLALFYLDLTYTGARSGFIAIWMALISFTSLFFFKKIKGVSIILFLISFIAITFFIGTPISQIDKFTYPKIKSALQTKTETKKTPVVTSESSQTNAKKEIRLNITDSSKIRMIVWQGAIDVWKHNPIFGTGVETFAFAYYKFRPSEHNLTSEWDYLYNKAHNEYLNFLATIGIFGLGTYLFMIGFFLLIVLKQVLKQSNGHIVPNNIFTFALLGSYVSILVANFFGFSVVIANIYFFFIPAFIFVFLNLIDPKKVITFEIFKNKKQNSSANYSFSQGQWVLSLLTSFAGFYFLFTLFNFWLADKSYALGINYDKLGQYQEAYTKLHEAVLARSDEPVYKDELAVNDGILAAALLYQKETSSSKLLLSEAINTSDELAKEHPNNVVFAKSRVRIFYTLSQVDQKYLPDALKAIIRANELAPTDAKISYNLGLLYGQTGNAEKAVETLEKTVKLKNDYHEAYYALGLYYHETAVDKNGKVVNQNMQKKAVGVMRFLEKNFPADSNVTQALKNWGEI